MTVTQQRLGGTETETAADQLRGTTTGDKIAVNGKQPFTVISVVEKDGRLSDRWHVVGPRYGEYLLAIVGDDNVILTEVDDPLSIVESVSSFRVHERQAAEDAAKVTACRESSRYPDPLGE